MFPILLFHSKFCSNKRFTTDGIHLFNDKGCHLFIGELQCISFAIIQRDGFGLFLQHIAIRRLYFFYDITILSEVGNRNGAIAVCGKDAIVSSNDIAFGCCYLKLRTRQWITVICVFLQNHERAHRLVLEMHFVCSTICTNFNGLRFCIAGIPFWCNALSYYITAWFQIWNQDFAITVCSIHTVAVSNHRSITCCYLESGIGQRFIGQSIYFCDEQRAVRIVSEYYFHNRCSVCFHIDCLHICFCDDVVVRCFCFSDRISTCFQSSDNNNTGMISCCRADQFAVLTTCFTRDSEYFKGCTIQHFPCVGICFLDNQTVQRIVYDTVYHFVIIPTGDFNTFGRCTAACATSTAATCDIIILQVRVIARIQVNTSYRICRFLVTLCWNGFCYDIPARFYIRQFDSAIFIGLECTDCCNCTIVFLMLDLECGVWNTLVGCIICFLDDQCRVFDVFKH